MTTPYASIIDSGLTIGNVNSSTINKYVSLTSTVSNIINLTGTNISTPVILSNIKDPINPTDSTNRN